jgi:hypothetical protein
LFSLKIYFKSKSTLFLSGPAQLPPFPQLAHALTHATRSPASCDRCPSGHRLRQPCTMPAGRAPHALLLHMAPSRWTPPPSFLLPRALSRPPPPFFSLFLLFLGMPHCCAAPCFPSSVSTGRPGAPVALRPLPPPVVHLPGTRASRVGLNHHRHPHFLASSASGHPSSPFVPFEPQINRLALSPSRGALLDHRRPLSPRLPSASPCPPPRRSVNRVTPEVSPKLRATTATHAAATSMPPRGQGAW